MPIFAAGISRCGVFIIHLVQLFNWFPIKHLPWILAILWAAMHSGYIVWINIDLKYDYIKFFTVALFYLSFAFIDYFYFKSHPSEANIFVDDIERTSE